MTADQPPVRDLPTVRSLPVDKVRESARNPRKIPGRAVELVAHSLSRFGWKQPLVVDEDGTLIVGHTRYRAARSLGLTHVPAIIASDLSPEEVDAYRIADNRSHDFTTWDLPSLTALLDELADDFSDVLALTDWEAVASDLDSITNGLDLPAGAVASLHEGVQVTVRFETKAQALAAQDAIMDLPGVFDVRHNF